MRTPGRESIEVRESTRVWCGALLTLVRAISPLKLPSLNTDLYRLPTREESIPRGRGEPARLRMPWTSSRSRASGESSRGALRRSGVDRHSMPSAVDRTFAAGSCVTKTSAQDARLRLADAGPRWGRAAARHAPLRALALGARPGPERRTPGEKMPQSWVSAECCCCLHVTHSPRPQQIMSGRES